MTVHLRAISVPDAAAFVSVRGRLRLLRPPYTLATSPELGEGELEDALKRSLFEPADKSFSTVGDAIAFLRDENRKWAKQLGLPTGGTFSADELLSDASPALATQIIEKVERELLPAQKFEIAEMLLAGVIKCFEGNTALQLRSARLLAGIKVIKERKESTIFIRDQRFRTLQDAGVSKKISEISDTIRERGCVLEVGC